jgi:deazaflavin-dependent oxidoreductase (nitroreductase family)
LFGREHVDRYRETDGEEGHDWRGTTVLLLTTTGRNSGTKRTTPLIYQRHEDDHLVVASNGGGDLPGSFLNLQDDPIVALQVKADHHTARARVATAEEKPELWRIMTATGAPYDEFQAKADREIPVVVPRAGLGRAAAYSTTPNALGAGQAARLDGPRTVP